MVVHPPDAAWRSIPRRARFYRVAHACWAIASLTALAYVWACAIVRRRDRLLAASVTFLSVQGVGLVIGRGNCPMSPIQRRLGDPVPLFELVLRPRAARAAIPALTLVTIAGFVAGVLRPPRRAVATGDG